MAELTRERLQELRRIAEAATPGPWEWDKYLHLFSATGKPVLTKPFSPDNPDVVEARPEDLDYIERFDPETALALLDRIEQLEADNNKLERENGEFYRRIERLEAKLARQRVVLRRLQLAVERRNSQDRTEALRRKLSDEKRLLDRIEALERRNSEIAQLIIDAITWFYDEDTGSVTVTDDDPRLGLDRLRQALLMLDPAAAARFPQFYRW